MRFMDRDILHKYWLNDRHSQVLYDNDLKLFIVEMYKKTKGGMKKITTKPMNTEQLAEKFVEGLGSYGLKLSITKGICK